MQSSGTVAVAGQAQGTPRGAVCRSPSDIPVKFVPVPGGKWEPDIARDQPLPTVMAAQLPCRGLPFLLEKPPCFPGML